MFSGKLILWQNKSKVRWEMAHIARTSRAKTMVSTLATKIRIKQIKLQLRVLIDKLTTFSERRLEFGRRKRFICIMHN